MTLRLPRQVTLVEWLDDGNMSQYVWRVDEKTVRKLRALLGEPGQRQVIPMELVGEMQILALEHDVISLSPST